jgi:hypothetical protein
MNALHRTRTIVLKHPEMDVTVEAEILGFWFNELGRNVGYQLEFADGIRHLTYAEIRQLKQGEDEVESAEIDIPALTNGSDGTIAPFHPRRVAAHPLAIKRHFINRAKRLFGGVQ